MTKRLVANDAFLKQTPLGRNKHSNTRGDMVHKAIKEPKAANICPNGNPVDSASNKSSHVPTYLKPISWTKIATQVAHFKENSTGAGQEEDDTVFDESDREAIDYESIVGRGNHPIANERDKI